MNNKGALVSKIIIIVCLLFIIGAVLVAANKYSLGYEISIYSSTPRLFWILIFGCVVVDIILFSFQVFRNEQLPSFVLWPLGFAHIAVLLLPVMRGYLIYSISDPLVHIGIASDINASGHIESTNLYPAIHVLISELSLMGNISLPKTGELLPVFLSLVFALLNMYLLARVVLPKKSHALFAFALFSGFLLNSLHVMVYPHTLAFFLVLLVLNIRLDDELFYRLEGRIAIILLLIAVPFSHPGPSTIVVFFLVIIELFDKFFYKGQWIKLLSINLPLISIIIIFSWYSSFNEFNRIFPAMWDNLLDPFGSRHVEILATTIQNTLDAKGTIFLFLKLYGDSFLCLVLAIWGIGMILRSKELNGKKYYRLLILVAVWIVAVFMETLVFISSRTQTIGRFVNLNYIIFLSPMFAGYALFEVLSRLPRIMAILLSSITLTSFWVIGILGIYQSPWVLQPNFQITTEDVKGTDWFFQNKRIEVLYSTMGYIPTLPYYSLGNIVAHSREDIRQSNSQMMKNYESVLPIGFGYNRFSTIGEALQESRYLILTKRFYLINSDPLNFKWLTVDPRIFTPGFQSEDFEKLDNDPSVEKLYSNGEFDIFFASGY